MSIPGSSKSSAVALSIADLVAHLARKFSKRSGKTGALLLLKLPPYSRKINVIKLRNNWAKAHEVLLLFTTVG